MIFDFFAFIGVPKDKNQKGLMGQTMRLKDNFKNM